MESRARCWCRCRGDAPLGRIRCVVGVRFLVVVVVVVVLVLVLVVGSKVASILASCI